MDFGASRELRGLGYSKGNQPRKSVCARRLGHVPGFDANPQGELVPSRCSTAFLFFGPFSASLWVTLHGTPPSDSMHGKAAAGGHRDPVSLESLWGLLKEEAGAGFKTSAIFLRGLARVLFAHFGT